MSKKTFFVSDLHLGAYGGEQNRQQEQKILRWLDVVVPQADAIYFVGDIFDFWFEWKRVVPRGYVRFLGRLASFVDAGLPVYFFSGNHDVWMFDYFEQEIGLTVYRDITTKTIYGKKFYLAHGDGLGPGDNMFKRIKSVFTSRLAQALFASCIHPNAAIRFAEAWSGSSRKKHDEKFTTAETEWLVQHSQAVLAHEHFDYFVYGHRHIPLIHPLAHNSTYVNCGDWLCKSTYAVFDGQTIDIQKFHQ